MLSNHLGSKMFYNLSAHKYCQRVYVLTTSWYVTFVIILRKYSIWQVNYIIGISLIERSSIDIRKSSQIQYLEFYYLLSMRFLFNVCTCLACFPYLNLKCISDMRSTMLLVLLEGVGQICTCWYAHTYAQMRVMRK